MSKRCHLDQYYTRQSVADQCISEFRDVVLPFNRTHVIEPSAGRGAFMAYSDKTIGYDIQPRDKRIKKADWFAITREDMPDIPCKIAFLGNPPFGHAASMAIDFFNHCAALGNTIAFILPKTFKKDSVQNKLNLRFHLVHESYIPKYAFLLYGQRHHVPCVFQIWRKGRVRRDIVSVENTFLEFVTKDEATKDTFCIRRIGGKAGRLLEGMEHSESTTYFCNELKVGVRSAIANIDLAVVDYTAGVRSISKMELIKEIGKVMK